MLDALKSGAEWDAVHDGFAPGAARNAVDCAVWDWRARRSGQHAWALLDLPAPRPIETVLTIGLDTPWAMAAAAQAATGHAILKRSEEHTSELQSLMRISYAVFCLKKKNTITTTH